MPTPAPVTRATRPWRDGVDVIGSCRRYPRDSLRSSRGLRILLVAFGMGFVPVPRRLDNRANVGVARLPAEVLLNPVRRRDQHGRIAGAASSLLDRHLL